MDRAAVAIAQLQCLAAVASFEHDVALRAKQIASQFANHVGVIDDEHDFRAGRRAFRKGAAVATVGAASVAGR